MKRKRGRTRSERGNTLVEFAISFVVLWAFLVGIFQFGYAMYVYNGLASTVASGARFASQVKFDAPANSFVPKVKNMVVYGSPNGGVQPVVPGLKAEQVEVTWTTDAAGVPQTITVAIRDYAVNAVFTSYRFTRKPSVTMRYAGTFTT
jgi:Flp pilus assembly protein TadG